MTQGWSLRFELAAVDKSIKQLVLKHSFFSDLVKEQGKCCGRSPQHFPSVVDSEWFVRWFGFTSFATLLPRFDAGFSYRAAMLETIRLVAGFHNMAVMRQPIQQRCRHLGIDEHAGPFREAQIGRDDHAGVFVEAWRAGETARLHQSG